MSEPFKLPSREDLDGIARELGLSPTQTHELDLVIRHAHADLEGFLRTRIDRHERSRRSGQLKDVHAAIGGLLASLGSNDATLDDINESLPFDAREVIGEVVSPDLIAAVTGRTKRDLRFEHFRRSAGLQHGARLLAAQLRLIKDPLDAWLDAEVQDPGGPEPDLVRSHLIAALARAAPQILGRRATATANGKFTRLVVAVYNACALNDAGIEKRIERVLKALKRQSP